MYRYIPVHTILPDPVQVYHDHDRIPDDPVNLVILDLLSLLSGWASARRAAFLSTFKFRDGIGKF
jgi:hypothetical protein